MVFGNGKKKLKEAFRRKFAPTEEELTKKRKLIREARFRDLERLQFLEEKAKRVQNISFRKAQIRKARQQYKPQGGTSPFDALVFGATPTSKDKKKQAKDKKELNDLLFGS